MKKLWLALPVAVLTAGLSGCLTPPNWRQPGTAECQRGRARVADPYPQTDAAPPIVGGRPRQFDVPRTEVVRTQVPHGVDWLPRNWRRR